MLAKFLFNILVRTYFVLIITIRQTASMFQEHLRDIYRALVFDIFQDGKQLFLLFAMFAKAVDSWYLRSRKSQCGHGLIDCQCVPHIWIRELYFMIRQDTIKHFCSCNLFDRNKSEIVTSIILLIFAVVQASNVCVCRNSEFV